MADDTQILNVGIDGGLNLKSEPQRLAPPAVTRADNAWHVQPGNVQQLPPFYSLFNDAPTPYTPYHVYNLSTRDISPPAPLGDLLVHGEYVDNGYSADAGNVPATGFTRPLWAYNTARTVSYEAPSLPFSLRVRPLSAPLAVNVTPSSKPTVYGNQLLMAREEGTTTRRRYMIGAIQNFVFQATAGYVDGLSRTYSFNVGSNLVSADLLGVQNTSPAQVALLAVGSSTTTLYTYNFAGTQQGTVTIPTVANYNAPNAQLFHHAGRTYCGYTGPAANTAVNIRDIVSTTIQQVTTSTTTVAINLAFSSPYTHQSLTGASFLAMVYNGALYVLVYNGGNFSVVAGPVALATPATVPASGTYNYAATVQAMVADSQGGLGPGAKLSIVVFSHFPEKAANPGFYSGAPVPGYQSVLCTKFNFVANASNPTSTGTLTAAASNVFRTAAGAGLVSKAFCSNPPEAAYAGPTAAKYAMVCVQSGATEPDVAQTYTQTAADIYGSGDRDSQPTYFVIDHNADIVGRFLEGNAATRPANLAYLGKGNAFANTDAPFPGVMSLANPLFSDGTADDNSTLTVTIPVWGALNARYGGCYAVPSTSSALRYASRAVNSATYIPQAATLSFNGAASGPPAINVGAHTYLSGPCPLVHDGNGLVEQNFHFGAHNIVFNTASAANTYGYNYAIVYNWYDGQGRLHRSQPSLPTTVTSNSATVPPTLNYFVPLMPSFKTLIGQPIFVEVYRTLQENTGDTSYLIDTVQLPAMSKATSAPVMFASLASGSQAALPTDVSQQPALYTSPNARTTGRTYYTSPPRASFWQVAAKGRCFALSQVGGAHRIYFSSVAADTVPFEWNDLGYMPVPPDIGDARSLEVIDDKLVVLGTRGNAVMTGDGPPPADTIAAPNPSAYFSPVTPIPVPAGVIGSGAPARIPDGIIFQGYSGIQLIGRDLSITPAGVNVDVLTGRQVGNSGTVYGKGVTLPTLQSVVWPNPRGSALVYAYLTKKWSTWPLLGGAAVLAQKMDGGVWAALQPIVGTKLTPYGAGTAGADVGYLGTTYAPISGNSTSAGLVLETPWVLLGGSSTAEADLYDMALIGTWLGPHVLRVEQAYNYGAYTLSQTLDMSAAPLTYQTRWRPQSSSRVWAVRYRVSLLPVSTLNAGYLMAELADLVVYSTAQVGTTRVGQGMTR